MFCIVSNILTQSPLHSLIPGQFFDEAEGAQATQDDGNFGTVPMPTVTMAYRTYGLPYLWPTVPMPTVPMPVTMAYRTYAYRTYGDCGALQNNCLTFKTCKPSIE